MRRVALYLAACVAVVSAIGLYAQQADSIASINNPPVASQPVPRLIMFSGTLKDLTGKPLTGPVDLNFAIYREQADAAPLWQESQTLNLDEQGHYAALLGAMQPEGLPVDLFTSGEARWLGVSIGRLPEQPRVLLVSVPYALKANDAEMLAGKPASAYALAPAAESATSQGSGTAGATGPRGAATPDVAAPGKPKSGPKPNVSGTGTQYYIPMWTDSAGTVLGNSVIYQKSGLVGIGTTTPAAKLDVAGSVGHFLVDTSGAQFRFTRGGANYFQAATAGGYFDFVVNGLTPSDATASLKLAANGQVDFMAGNVGIGTLTPAQKLEVSGNLKISGAGNAIIFSDGSVQSTAGSGGGGGGGTITGVTAGTGLSGGGTTGNVTLRLASASCAAGSALTGLPLTCQPVATAGSYATLGSNAFVGNQTITGNLSVTANQTISGNLNLTGTLNGWTIVAAKSNACTLLGQAFPSCTSANGTGGYAGLVSGGTGQVVRAKSIRSLEVGGKRSGLMPETAPFSCVPGANCIGDGVLGGTISGGGGTTSGLGGTTTYEHLVSNHWGTVAGGAANSAGDATGPSSVNCCQTVSGGFLNEASGAAATVPGGWNNLASGTASFAAGCEASAMNVGSFVWSGYSGGASCTPVTSSAIGQFIALAPGGFEFFPSASTTSPVFSIAPTTGNVGIGTATPASALDVHGTGNFTGLVTFASGQTFPGTSTITGVTAGADLTGGGTSGTVTLNLDTNKVPTLAAGSNVFTGGITAASFSGPLAGNVTGNVSGSSGSTTGNAATATTAATATNALALGSVAAAHYARLDIGNSFTGNQAVTGNLSITGSLNSALVLVPSVTDTSSPSCIPTGNCVSANVLTGYMGTTGGNSITAGVTGATIAGGGGSVVGYAYANRVTDDWGTVGGGLQNQAGDNAGTVSDHMYATVAGGWSNTASGGAATVAGGEGNTAGGLFSTVAGGDYNTASGDVSTVAGGNGNTASGQYSTVAGGQTNTATASYSFAAGWCAHAVNDGAFVWNGSPPKTGMNTCNAVITSAAVEQFVANAPGGFWLGNATANTTATMPSGAFLYTTTGTYLTTAGNWQVPSDRNLKTAFQPLDQSSLLGRIGRLPITSWQYKVDPSSIRHIGPMAQDFYSAFQLGNDDKHISSIDEGGVALAGVQALYRLSLEKDAQIRKLTGEVNRLKNVEQQMATLEARLAQIEARTAKPQPRSANRAAPAKPAAGSMTLAKAQF